MLVKSNKNLLGFKASLLAKRLGISIADAKKLKTGELVKVEKFDEQYGLAYSLIVTNDEKDKKAEKKKDEAN